MKILVSVTHLLGVGHLNRAAAIARAFAAAGHEVTLASGGMPSPLLDSTGFTVIQLPPVRVEGTAFSHLLDASGEAASLAHLEARAAKLVATLRALRPDVVITELFPFGRRALAAEHLALLNAAHALRPRPLVLSSARDVLAASRRPERIAQSHAHLRAFYDAVLVHGDPAVLPLEASWPVDDGVGALLRYTGYIDDGSAAIARSDAIDPVPQGEILVSGGGSAASLPVYRAAIGAAAILARHPWRLLVGAGVSEADFKSLLEAAPDHLTVERARRDFPALLARAAVAVSQFGYNTAVDLLRAGTRAVVVPFEDGGETEQRLRAERFAREGLVTVLPQEELSADRLAETVRAALAGPQPQAASIDRNGLSRTLDIVAELAAMPRQATTARLAAPGSFPDTASRWAALDDALSRRAHRGATLDFWWRDDDAVGPTAALDKLLAMAARHGMPLALAVIPAAAGPELAARLSAEPSVDVLVHGFGHRNHAPAGEKKAEFGDHRPLDAVHAEARAGLERLRALLPAKLVPTFVPPWNRIAPGLAATLPELGYAGLSTFKQREPATGLVIANCHCDPIDWRGSRSLLDPQILISRLASVILTAPDDEPIGLLTHHLAHDEAIWRFCEDLLGRLTASAIVRPLAARAIFTPADAADPDAGASP
ncbi:MULTISPECIES: glycosyltransferase [unclassified Chelatococcus]|uniref:glycosyltransferase n=1 Tax=unclassified Chelatococcus TaxID=2638111 RepID=UPI001BCB798E|nr:MULTISPECIES: glycosyltransferase [unclassified Chelatococcus]MBS7698417.1 glycosyl transferase family 28 [Chelatococcus sp. YT9]MBX3558816.1 glycosyl transferase family 28 [Chelatococcus sp.]